jgi:hypothetical protein
MTDSSDKDILKLELPRKTTDRGIAIDFTAVLRNPEFGIPPKFEPFSNVTTVNGPVIPGHDANDEPTQTRPFNAENDELWFCTRPFSTIF